MTKVKYFLSIFIFSIICLLFCNYNNTKPQPKQKEIIFWTVQLSPFRNYMNNVISKFEKENETIKIKWIDISYAEAEKRILASLLSNSMPDLINITSDFNMTLANKGALTSIHTISNQYATPILKTITIDKTIWGLPFYATSAITVYNKELIKNFNVKKQPQTYMQLFDLIEQSPSINNKYIFMPTLTENDTFYKILNKYNLNSPDTITNSETIKFFTIIKKLYDEEKIPKESITQTHREVLEKYSSGQIAYLQIGANFLNIIKENSLDIYNKTDVSTQFYGKEKTFDFSLMTLAIPQKAKYKAEALLFAEFLTNEENQLEFAKQTGVLPCNEKALNDEYFNATNSKDLQIKARNIAAKQLLSPINYPQQTSKHKEIITHINQTIEQILLEDNTVDAQLKNLSKNWKILISK